MFIENQVQEFEFKWAEKWLPDKAKILDLGYGDGLYIKNLMNQDDVTLLEGSSALCDEANRQISINQSKIQVVETFFEDFTTSEKYDVVIASHVLEHVDSPNLLLNRIYQWLKPEGYVLIVVPNSESLHRRLGVAMNLQDKLDSLSPRDHQVGHQRVYSLSSLKEEIQNSGFEVIDHRGFFTKSLANSQMVHLSEEVIEGLCRLSSELPTEMGANIGLVAKISGARE
jgi:2-polyprenyl-3-methyl-5-hydroxy-6-metoxy-1,4-benzoquinol methylase